ncbi:MAG: hypothetical protein J0L88_00595 [Xanthomonadales bacterium]|nr:hypothetical protein [Xanthomonadales bacterium]
MSKDILRADPALRRTTWIVLGAAGFACLVTLAAFQRWLGGFGDEVPVADLVARMNKLIAIALTGSALCFAILAWLAARTSRRTAETGQWPAPDARVIRDTPVRRGLAAKRIARQFEIAGVVLLLLALGAGAMSLRLFGKG